MIKNSRCILVIFFIMNGVIYSQTPRKIVNEFYIGNIQYVVDHSLFPVKGLGTDVDTLFRNKKRLKLQLSLWRKEMQFLPNDDKIMYKIIEFNSGDEINCGIQINVLNNDDELESESAYIFTFKKIKEGKFRLIRILFAG